MIEIENMTEMDKIKRMMELRDELFNLANSFAGDETDSAAVLLRESCNNILCAKKWLYRTLDEFDFDDVSLRMFGNLKNYVLSRPRAETKDYV